MKITKLIFTLLALTGSTIVNSQTLKTFSGDVDQGKATFTYYQDEKTGNDVRHGAFKFNESTKSEESSYSCVISGSYKHGFKDGTWSHTINNVDLSSGNNVYQTGTVTLIAEYSNGMPNGSWKYTSNFKLRKKLYSLLGWSWSGYQQTRPESISVNFKEGVLAGSINVKTAHNDVIGQTDENGLWIGKWMLNDNSGELIEVELNKGIVSKFIVRRSGKVEFNSNYDAELLEIQKRIATMPEKEGQTLCRQKRVKMNIIKSQKQFVIEDYLMNSMFKHRATDGDKTYTADEYGNRTDSKNYGRYITVERVEQKPLSSIPEYRNATKAEHFQNIINYYQFNLSEEDMNALVQKFDEATAKEKELARQEQACEQVKVATREINELRVINQIIAPQRQGAIWEEKLLPSIARLYKELFEKYGITTAKLYKALDIPYFDNHNNNIDYITMLEQRKQLLSILQQEGLAQIERVKQYNVDILNLHKLITEIESKYVVVTGGGNVYQSSTSKIIKKPIYESYQMLLSGLLDSVSPENISDAIKLSATILELASQDTKEMEKQLKKAKDIEQKRLLLIK